MAKEHTEGAAAARALAARLPGWTVWYGEHTRRFWALSRAKGRSGASHAEAATAEELERMVRRIEDGVPAQASSEREAPTRETPRATPAPAPAAAEPEPRREPARPAGAVTAAS
ncbi:hypothetical protein Ppa06_58760 [Planomonospora parontospora subsp. parontospora]|uniref:Uncharacterized protein n=2 Tax=Planomonospora parontospora TaxID=58119 RepID=A0AA37F7W7_9ACTN|nr:hypothetical protein [Planomonospora parontospora]GGK92851.1 hypothetical protein GCM10010126_60200 [Planomonospora parontospora]GII12078.1 hypothetical protein Ppa06_58760 [Planomonospora parontospora subsp. parontospora]